MSTANIDVSKKLAGVITIVPQKFVNALLVLHDKLKDTGIKWIVNGDLAERLRVVDVEPDSIEIVCSKEDAERIFRIVHDLKPKLIAFKTQQLSRNALIKGKEYPVYTRSYFFDFVLGGVNVNVQGDLQFKVDDWEWGEVFKFTPDYVNIVGKEIAVTPLQIRRELYQNLGWSERLEKVDSLLHRSSLNGR